MDQISGHLTRRERLRRPRLTQPLDISTVKLTANLSESHRGAYRRLPLRCARALGAFDDERRIVAAMQAAACMSTRSKVRHPWHGGRSVELRKQGRQDSIIFDGILEAEHVASRRAKPDIGPVADPDA